ncbi:unnamed protein product [Sympodiomycopsis kandeliae]
MDIPLSSDALDLAIHPGPSNNLIAVGLISGKVQLVDVTAFVEQSKNQSKKTVKKRKVQKSANTDAGSGVDSSSDEIELDSGNKLYEKKWSTRFSKKSCRGVEFDHDGSRLWCLSKDKSIYALDPSTSQITTQWASAHSAAPSRLLPLPNHKNLLVTGDDDGIVNLWDDRISQGSKTSSSATPVRSYDHHFDWITDFHYSSHLAPPKLTAEQRDRKKKEAAKAKARKDRNKTSRDSSEDSEDSDAELESSEPMRLGRERLVCTSGDGSLSVIDFRQSKSSSTTKDTKKKSAQNSGVEVSEDQEDELLSITSIKNDTKLVVGTQLGILSLWSPSKGLLDHIDRIPGHPQSIDTLLNLDSETILTGSSDGLIRVVQILPHKFLGVVVDHGMGLPVERMKRKDGLLVSCGHAGEVKCTDITSLLEDDDDDDDEDDDEEQDAGEDAETLARRINTSQGDESDDDDDEEEEEEGDDNEPLEGGHLSSDDEDAEDSDNDDDSPPPPPPSKPMTNKEKQRAKLLASGGDTKDAHETQDFFADL